MTVINIFFWRKIRKVWRGGMIHVKYSYGQSNIKISQQMALIFSPASREEWQTWNRTGRAAAVMRERSLLPLAWTSLVVGLVPQLRRVNHRVLVVKIICWQAGLGCPYDDNDSSHGQILSMAQCIICMPSTDLWSVSVRSWPNYWRPEKQQFKV